MLIFDYECSIHLNTLYPQHCVQTYTEHICRWLGLPTQTWKANGLKDDLSLLYYDELLLQTKWVLTVCSVNAWTQSILALSFALRVKGIGEKIL